ncbi:MAG: hypothetical protein QM681_20275 [Novosphingobium sp.]
MQTDGFEALWPLLFKPAFRRTAAKSWVVNSDERPVSSLLDAVRGKARVEIFSNCDKGNRAFPREQNISAFDIALIKQPPIPCNRYAWL